MASTTFSEDAKRLFGTVNLYEILQLQDTPLTSRHTLSQDAIKKAFFKQSLRYHPDRCTNESRKEEFTQKFQLINRAYTILGDEEKRKIYDETGLLDDAELGDSETDWLREWRRRFPKITKQQIDDYIKQYRESGEERDEIRESYVKNKGDMGKIMVDVIGLTYEDEERVRAIIDEMIKDGQLVATKHYTNESKATRDRRRKAAEKEAKEAERVLREIEAKEGTSDLHALIRKRQLDRSSSFSDDLTAKYVKPKTKRKKKSITK